MPDGFHVLLLAANALILCLTARYAARARFDRRLARMAATYVRRALFRQRQSEPNEYLAHPATLPFPEDRVAPHAPSLRCDDDSGVDRETPDRH